MFLPPHVVLCNSAHMMLKWSLSEEVVVFPLLWKPLCALYKDSACKCSNSLATFLVSLIASVLVAFIDECCNRHSSATTEEAFHHPSGGPPGQLLHVFIE